MARKAGHATGRRRRGRELRLTVQAVFCLESLWGKAEDVVAAIMAGPVFHRCTAMRRSLIPLALFALSNLSIATAGVHVGLGPVDEVEGVGSQALTLSWETEAPHPWEFMAGVIDQREKAMMHTPRVYFGAVSKRFTWKGWFAQGGIAATNSNTEVLSEHWQFMTGIGYRHKRFTVSLRHLSNANTGGRNRGENLLLVQYGF